MHEKIKIFDKKFLVTITLFNPTIILLEKRFSAGKNMIIHSKQKKPRGHRPRGFFLFGAYASLTFTAAGPFSPSSRS
jgi:hypothetical protein